MYLILGAAERSFVNQIKVFQISRRQVHKSTMVAVIPSLLNGIMVWHRNRQPFNTNSVAMSFQTPLQLSFANNTPSIHDEPCTAMTTSRVKHLKGNHARSADTLSLDASAKYKPGSMGGRG